MKPSSNKALKMLRRAGDRGVTTGEFLEEGIGRFGARVAELREAGHHVVTERVRGNKFRYILKPSVEVGAAAYTQEAGADLDGLSRVHPHGAPPSPAAPPEPDPAGSTSPPARRGTPERLVLLIDSTGEQPLWEGYRWENADGTTRREVLTR